MPFYERIDAPATPAQKNLLKALSAEKLGMKELAGEPVRAALTAAPGNGQSFGGIKVSTDSGWFAARPSGTEDVYKIYAESFRSEDHLRQIQQRRPARHREGVRWLRAFAGKPALVRSSCVTEAGAQEGLTISRWIPPHLVHRIVQYSDPALPAMTRRTAIWASQCGQSDRI